ncbi:MAG: hypothetical protein LLG02_06425 [Pelosinus sp.]|nr:hypothetical protein [Pelosinus sp.]
MNKELLFAADLEKNILSELKKMTENAAIVLGPALHMLIAAEEGWNELFHLLAENQPQYPALSTEILAGSDQEWLKVIAPLKEVEIQNTDSLILFWMLYALIERTAQYYQQAAANSAYPDQRQFFNSLSQCKLLLKKRIDSIMRIMYNHAWAEVGFAPFMLGK